ncbi:MAG: cytochrome c oxidase assembly factor 1 family protein [Planctomycetota bacterium]|nr:cytochrome c oxidase assembly factor 1 family protein [Planctomycetota bacterium]
MTAPYPPPPSPLVSPPPAVSNPSWFRQHWLACLGCGCFTLASLGVAGVAAIIFLAFAAMKQTDVYRESLRLVANSPQAAAALGTPISDGWWVSGNVNVQNGSGEADLRYPVSGPKGEGVVAVEASRRNGVWHLRSLTLEHAGQRIDLLAGARSGP